MKIDYTLPGFEPETELAKGVAESFNSPFQNRIRSFERRQPVAWRDLLGLSETPPDPAQLPAPPRSQTNEVSDPAIQRQQWHDLLSQHSGFEEMLNSPAAVRRMMAVLNSHQKEADNLFSRGLSEGEP